jgi:hypothetical protein
MALTNQQRVGKALNILREGLGDFVVREFESRFGANAQAAAKDRLVADRLRSNKPIQEWDVAALLRLVFDSWNEIFGQVLGHAERSIVSELRTVRDRWAHQENFSSDDTDRALVSVERLLSAISSLQSEVVRTMKLELRRQVYDEQVRGEKRKVGGSLVEAAATGALKPWREVVTPHADVASGRYQQAEFAAGSPHTQADDVEVGGVRGREALNRLRNVVGRVESSWRPATAEEGFEIVRRRLFEPIAGDQFKNRDITTQAFSELYHSQSAEFPPECRSADYEKRIRAAYPIHPEIFDQLYGSWSTLVKFQRTRGVLRLMASVIHSLWEKGDNRPLILPSMIPIDDPRVQSELTRYLSDNWSPIIEKDVDGPNSLPVRIDGEQPNLGKVSAARRVARTIYLGSAPSAGVAHRGIEDRHVKLGCVMPGKSPAVFGDGLRRLAAAATYLYQDGNRFWYDTQATVTKLAEDRAEQLKRDQDSRV